MSPAEVLALLTALDAAFTLGGELVKAAIVRAPQLNTAALPDLADLDAARAEALDRVTPSEP